MYIPAFFLSLGIGIVNPVLPLFAKSFDVSYGVATWVITSAGLGRVLADIPAGIMMDRIGRKRVLMLGALLATISGLLSGIAQGFFELVAYRILTGVSMAMWIGARQTMVADTVDMSNRGKVMSTFLVFSQMGMSFGPALGGFVASGFGIRAPFFAYSATSLITLVLSFLLIHERRHDVPNKQEVVSTSGVSLVNYRILLTVSFFALGYATFANNARLAARNALIPFYGTATLSLNLQEIGLLLSAFAFSTVLLAVPAGMVMDRFGRKKTLIPSLLLSTTALFLFPSTTDFFQALYVSILMGVASGVGAGAMGTVAADMSPNEWRGRFMSIWRLIGDVGTMGGPLMAGFLIDVYSLNMAFYGLGAIMLLAAITSQIFLKETFKKA